jgi:hypothetical protein
LVLSFLSLAVYSGGSAAMTWPVSLTVTASVSSSSVTVVSTRSGSVPVTVVGLLDEPVAEFVQVVAKPAGIAHVDAPAEGCEPDRLPSGLAVDCRERAEDIDPERVRERRERLGRVYPRRFVGAVALLRVVGWRSHDHVTRAYTRRMTGLSRATSTNPSVGAT